MTIYVEVMGYMSSYTPPLYVGVIINPYPNLDGVLANLCC